MRELFVVIPATNRHDMLDDLITSIDQPSDHVILIDNQSNPPLSDSFSDRATIILNEDPELNIQKWWNMGWAEAERRSSGDYAVVFLNSDTLTTKKDIETLVKGIDKYNASVTFFDHCRVLKRGRINRRTEPGPGPWEHKMTGWCFAVRGEIGARFDERMAWWYGDDDFDWRARQEFGGVVMIPGVWADNRDANGAQRDRPELHDQIERDRKVFLGKWGVDILE